MEAAKHQIPRTAPVRLAIQPMTIEAHAEDRVRTRRWQMILAWSLTVVATPAAAHLAWSFADVTAAWFTSMIPGV